MRPSGRGPEDLRQTAIEPEYTKHPEGSVLISVGDTRVLCTCSVEDRVPPFLMNTNKGWVTAEYGMIPRATNTRTARESTRGRQTGRTVEIQRLIGRSLRSVINLSLLGNRTLLVDCDVLQADGGTRTAAITGGFVALALAVQNLMARKLLQFSPLLDLVAATSIGMVDSVPCLDLDYTEDSSADVDMNLVMTGRGRFVEIQGTAEKDPFSHDELQRLLQLGARGIQQLVEMQRNTLKAKTDLGRLFPSAL